MHTTATRRGDELEAGQMEGLRGSTITSRIAISPHRGRKLCILQTLPACDKPFDLGVGKVSGVLSVYPCTSLPPDSLRLCKWVVLLICYRPAVDLGAVTAGQPGPFAWSTCAEQQAPPVSVVSESHCPLRVDYVLFANLCPRASVRRSRVGGARVPCRQSRDKASSDLPRRYRITRSSA